mgnify:CR=1 FL=1
MKKNTAVEYLEKIINHCKKYNRSIEQLDIEIAKEMEKEQIMEAHGDEQIYLKDDGSWKTIYAEEYYNQTYKNETK